MTIRTFDIFRYQLPLTHPLHLRGQDLTARSGAVIRLENNDGAVGWGEIAPLPGFSDESLDHALSQAAMLRYRLRGTDIPDNLEELSGGFERWLAPFKLAPSVRSGMEMTVLCLLAKSEGVTLARLVSHNPHQLVPLNGLISGSLDELPAHIDRVTASACTAVKIKVGQRSVDEDIAIVRKARTLLPDTVVIRLDANRAWEWKTAVAFAEGIAAISIEYIEEPLQDTSDLARFAAHTGLPIALDETVRECTPETLPLFDGLKAIIVRPLLLGGFENAMRFARRARSQTINTVLSSGVESGLGTTMLIQLAAAMTPDPIPVGLDTYSWFADDILSSRLKQTDGGYDVARAWDTLDTIDLARLTPVPHE